MLVFLYINIKFLLDSKGFHGKEVRQRRGNGVLYWLLFSTAIMIIIILFLVVDVLLLLHSWNVYYRKQTAERSYWFFFLFLFKFLDRLNSEN